MFLWLRQRAFFANRLLNVNYNKKVRFFSAVSIIIIFTAGSSVLIFNAYPDDHYSSLDGCLYMPDDSLRIGYWISILIVIIFGQVTLLGLFVYALTQTSGVNGGLLTQLKTLCYCKQSSRQHMQQKKIQLENSFSEISGHINTNTSHSSNLTPHNSRSHSSNAGKIRIILRKTLIFAIISILGDIIIQIFIHYITNPDGHRRFSVVVGNINTILNLLLLVFSFTEYREMLSSLCRRFK